MGLLVGTDRRQPEPHGLVPHAVDSIADGAKQGGDVAGSGVDDAEQVHGAISGSDGAVEGLPGALMWTDTINRDEASATQRVTVPADLVRAVRAYVAVPVGTAPQQFEFRVTSLDEQRETDVVETRFDAPEDE